MSTVILDVKEEVKRLPVLAKTLRQLHMLSGNECAFPDCQNKMLADDGALIGQVCHIEAAEEGGQRFNENQSNEDRRAFSNLLLMCYQHHIVTNNVDQYDVAAMRAIKSNHERRFTGVSQSTISPQHTCRPKDAPILVLKKLDTGTQKWTRDYSDAIRQSTPALATFEFECTHGASARSVIVNYRDIFISIEPTHFEKGDRVRLSAELSPYDRRFLGGAINEPLEVECITSTGEKVTLSILFSGYQAEQLL